MYIEQMCQDYQWLETIMFVVMYGMLLKEIDCHTKGREVNQRRSEGVARCGCSHT